ncbi:MAG: hypothetical protein AB9919_13250 [Geobacteraceae bacterium]
MKRPDNFSQYRKHSVENRKNLMFEQLCIHYSNNDKFKNVTSLARSLANHIKLKEEIQYHEGKRKNLTRISPTTLLRNPEYSIYLNAYIKGMFNDKSKDQVKPPPDLKELLRKRPDLHAYIKQKDLIISNLAENVAGDRTKPIDIVSIRTEVKQTDYSQKIRDLEIDLSKTIKCLYIILDHQKALLRVDFEKKAILDILSLGKATAIIDGDLIEPYFRYIAGQRQLLGK